MIAGDLNITLDSKEKKGGICGRDPMLKTVENFITFWDLIDFKPKKGRFAWANNRIGAANISARIDRFLVQSSLLMEKNIIISSSIFPKLSLNHKPILLLLEEEEDPSPIPF